jgi:hypothetical protein
MKTLNELAQSLGVKRVTLQCRLAMAARRNLKLKPHRMEVHGTLHNHYDPEQVKLIKTLLKTHPIGKRPGPKGKEKKA